MGGSVVRSLNRTFPPERRIASMDIFVAGLAGSVPPEGVPARSTFSSPFSPRMDNRSRFNFPPRSITASIPGSLTVRLATRNSRATMSEGETATSILGRSSIGLFSFPWRRRSRNITFPSTRITGGFPLGCAKETTALTSRNPDGIPYSRCSGRYAR